MQIFQKAVTDGWLCDNSYWGLHLVNQSPAVLGVTPLPGAQDVKVAKFVGADANWHGYPVAHWASPWDKPGMAVLKSWLNAGLINQPTLAKIHRGKACNL